MGEFQLSYHISRVIELLLTKNSRNISLIDPTSNKFIKNSR